MGAPSRDAKGGGEWGEIPIFSRLRDLRKLPQRGLAENSYDTV